MIARRLPLSLCSVVVLLSGCASPAVDHPAAAPRAVASDTILAAGEAEFPQDRWWLRYGDTALDELMAEAVQSAPDLALAAARLRAADALADQAGAARAPMVQADASAGFSKQSYNMGIPAAFVPKGLLDVGKLSLGLVFDPDLWGRDKAALAAARGDAAAARVDAAQARLMLETGLAMAWSDQAQLWAEHDVLADSVRVRADTLALTRQRLAAGLDTKADVELSEARLASVRAELAALDEALALGRNRIAALLGAGPDRGATLPRPALVWAAETSLPANLSAGLLSRRPDIVSARLRADAMAARVKVAKAAFYPDISLSAMVGLQSLNLSNLLKSDSSMAQFGPALSLPLFDGGLRNGRLDQAWAGYDEAVARYDGALVSALRDAADAVASRQALLFRLAQAREAAQSAGEAARLSRLRFKAGLDNRLQLLAAEDSALSSRRLVAVLEARAVLLDIMLVRALGGGFEFSRDSKGTPAP
ncbi:MAG TPA: efflux transporter outer membrane subunit [Chakrabartia sp.]|nr:efflux transporter outer membrane subunit [Chakrabartia sp.]